MLRVEQVGGLAVAYNTSDRRTVERELRKLSPTLFLDEAIEDTAHGPFWTVRDASVMTADGPLIVLAWREGNGRPKPLTLAIVEQVKRQEGALDGAVEGIVQRDRARREKRREQAAETYAEMEREHRQRIRAAELDSLPPFWRPKRFGKGA